MAIYIHFMKIMTAFIFTDLVSLNMSSDNTTFCDSENLYTLLDESDNCDPYRLVFYPHLTSTRSKGPTFLIFGNKGRVQKLD